MEPIIQLENVSFAYPNTFKLLFEELSLNIWPGTFTAVIGSNGSGKSTLAKLLNGILLPVSGRVLSVGLETAIERNLIPIRRRVGMVFQNPDNQLVANIVEDDVAFALENLGLPPDDIRFRVDQALTQVGMSEFSHHAPHLLSGGQKQRVAIAGVLAMRPEVLVLDEPTAMLDPVGRQEVMAVVRRLCRKEGITVVLITHHMDEVVHADRVIVMDHGRIAMDDPPRTVFSRVSALQAMKLNVPDSTLLAAQLYAAGLPMPGGILTPEECANAIKEALWSS